MALKPYKRLSELQMNYWLMKSEPDAFGIEDLKKCKNKTEPWDGIRNYQARNFMRDDMKVGDQAFFYHSNCKQPGIVGVMEVASEPYPDPTQFDPDSGYYDPKAYFDAPRWILVDVKYVRDLERIVTLKEMKADAESFGDFPLLKKGNRLSIMPVTRKQWNRVLKLEAKQPA